jgi:arylsulfatase A-like enzyme
MRRSSLHYLGLLRALVFLGASLALPGCQVASARPQAKAPNVILVMTDDQGYGDFGFNGNPVLRTPHLDAMANRSARLANFYVHGVCTPTRAALMTGRHPQRTRAFDTFLGRAMMNPSETTIAELMQEAGFATGIFGKWHLGDCYPMRAIDQGFQEALIHLGGGIGQSSDPVGGEGKYTDPILHHNGKPVATKGYCTDIYFDAAIDWIKKQTSNNQPFFTYLATNAPHGPFHDVPKDLYDYYKSQDLSHARFPQALGAKLTSKQNLDREARIYAMIENIDQNIGKLFTALDEMKIAEETLVIFLIDNGPNSRRYLAGFRGQKNRVHEGGVRSPLLFHWPSHLPQGLASDKICAHYDLLPTILHACNIAAPGDLDGRSLLPLLNRQSVSWPERAIFIQHHRGDLPIRNHNFVVRTQKYKLVNPTGFHNEISKAKEIFELYDMDADPYELRNLAKKNPAVLAKMRGLYNHWFDEIIQTPGIGLPPPIQLGAKPAPRVVLSRQDMRRDRRKGWGYMGYWLVDVVKPGPFRLTIRPHRSRGKTLPSEIHIKIGASTWKQAWSTGQPEAIMSVTLPGGLHKLEIDVTIGNKRTAAYQVEVQTE